MKSIYPLLCLVALPSFASSSQNVYWDTSKGIFSTYSVDGKYAGLVESLSANGHSVITGSEPMDTVDFSSYGILILNLGSNWYQSYTAAEAEAIERFVEAGGGLMVMSDNSACPNRNFKEVEDALGFSLNRRPRATLAKADHPLTMGVSRLPADGEGNVYIRPRADGMSFFDDLVVAIEHGRGRVVVLADINALSDEVRIEDSDVFFSNFLRWAGGYSAKTQNCMITDDGRLKCFGGNDFGQLGVGDTDARGMLEGEMETLAAVELGEGFAKVTSVSTGMGFTCAIGESGAVKCWGRNDLGQLFQGGSNNRGDEPGEMGDALAALSLDAPALKVAAGEIHACALLEGGAVTCWGNNDYGQRGGVAGGEQLSFPAGEVAVDISVGDIFSCALMASGRAYCWGRNNSGQLGIGSRESVGIDADEMGDALKPVNLPVSDAVAITSARASSCVRNAGGQVFCWGSNKNGELGAGHIENVGDDADESASPVNLGRGQIVSDIQCRSNHCCALMLQRTMKCWGGNRRGQLGLGSSEPLGISPTQMGDALPAVDFGGLETVEAIHLEPGVSCGLVGRGWVCFGDNGDGQLGQGDSLDRGASFDSLPSTVPGIMLEG